jgi:hypothetical protein
MIATQEIVEERLNICRTCAHLIPITLTCKKCGCFMKIKTKIEASVCPLGKW